MITFGNETKPLCEWSRDTGLHYMTIYSRIDRLGWSVEQALFTPPHSKPRER